MNKLREPLTSLRGVGPKTGEKYAAAGLYTLEDLVTYFPGRYDVFEEIEYDLQDAADGRMMAVCGFIEGTLTTSYAGRLKMTGGTVRLLPPEPQDEQGETGFHAPQGRPGPQGMQIAPDLPPRRDPRNGSRPGMTGPETGDRREGAALAVTWFNMPYLKNSLVPGKLYVFRGYVRQRGRGIRLTQPAIFDPEAYEQARHTLQPVYPMRGGLKEGSLRKLIAKALDEIGTAEDFLPEEILRTYGLVSEDEAFRSIHFPKSQEEMLRARARLVFDEFLLFILSIRRLREHREAAVHDYVMPRGSWTRQAIGSLPYTLTGAQQKVWAQVEKDLGGHRVMARLIQGDVGSGKTVIAFLAMIKAVENGGQAALMVPTEVLARQHFEAFEELSGRAGLAIRAGLLTGSTPAAEKRRVNEEISSGETQVIIGTHALITEKVRFRRLVLAVTDEQHRFGVKQREALGFKGADPHVLVMSATPIPRTLAVILYGDLDVSVIDELPAGRNPIMNCVVDTSWRPNAYAFILRQVREGHQAYVICPMVEESEELEAAGVTEYAGRLRHALPAEVTVEYLHGKMRPPEKNVIMERFAAGKIDVLVSTTVVEVGVNVPNATVMMVEDAQRFGLAALHQLRGRVGRGRAQSYCILVDTSSTGDGRKRLEIMKSTNDGFEIAGKDLQMRGPGDLFGIRQSGMMDFKIGDVFADAGILQSAQEAAERIIGEDVGLSSEKYLVLREKLQMYTDNDQTHINI